MTTKGADTMTRKATDITAKIDTTATIDIAELHVCSVNAEPVDVDWSDLAFDGDSETAGAFESWEIDAETGGEPEDAGGPMMNYAYPLDDQCPRIADNEPDDLARKIADLPLCVVRWQGSLWLALTGGGMDLSWEICEAYMRLGHLPPVHFCDLPGMAGRGTSPTDRAIIAACKRSASVTTQLGARIIADLDRLTERAKDYERERAKARP